MNQPGTPIIENEQPSVNGAVQNGEIPAFPGSADSYQPGQETTESTPSYSPAVLPRIEATIPYETPKVVETQPEEPKIQESKMPELQTNISFETSKSGERVFVNPDLGQSTFKGGVTSQQLVSKVAGYYTVHQGLVSDPKSGLLQQTSSSGDPTSATTWQATILYKILQAFWSALGL